MGRRSLFVSLTALPVCGMKPVSWSRQYRHFWFRRDAPMETTRNRWSFCSLIR